ncbi:MAG: restriction endonuclease [Candidatus Omnitrophica bacterium]|nr:restriction endonuclease [Candidatus Omnitrophota bacterium]
MSFYLIRVGEGSKYIDEARKEGFVAIGWEEVDDLSKFKNVGQIKKALQETSYNYTPTQLAINAGQVYRFGLEIQPGDIILSPLGKGEYIAGEAGDYYFQKTSRVGCPYPHRRKVKWMNKVLLKEDMSTSLGYSLGGLLTVFSLDKYSDEINALIQGDKYTPAEKPQRVRDVILEGLLEMDGREFEQFIRHVLEVVGFSSETTQYVSDKGIDVNGVLDAEGLADITLRVQVKRVRSSIGNKDILALRGALGQGEHGCFITTSGFTSQAIEEAEAKGKLHIKLIDGNDLSTLILRHFDELSDEYKSRFNIRRKKDFNIEEQFEIPGAGDRILDLDLASLPSGKKKIAKPDWDTLVCAAKEDGFKIAFLEQKAWWAVRLNPNTIPFIKYLAMYQVAPVSQITYYGEVDRIEPYEGKEWGENKYKLYLKGDPIKLKTPVGLGARPHLKPQGPKYASLDKILKARSLDDVWL